ncbi:MAG: glutamine synthetase, partial [Muribaculaceae bacterium]|nr:glutamine synthetase [Muribaculaceae bacterium]
SANIYQLLAAMVVAAREGFLMENALQRADELYVSVNIHSEGNAQKLQSLKSLPDSCALSAEALKKNRELYEKDGVFNPAMIDGIINTLLSFHDGTLRKNLEGNRKGMLELVEKYWNC